MAYKKSTAPEYYKLQTVPGSEKNLKVTKFDSDLDATSLYHMTWMDTANGGYYDCSCPAAKFDCRHKSILNDIKALDGIDSPKFYCHQAPLSKPELQGKLLDTNEVV